jgi:hypothetical protein
MNELADCGESSAMTDFVLGTQDTRWASDALGVSDAELTPANETMHYYGWHSLDGKLDGVFREYKDTVKARYGFERYTNGRWLEDPSLLMEKGQPGVRPITPEQARNYLISRF